MLKCLKRFQNRKQALDKVIVPQVIFLRYIVYLSKGRGRFYCIFVDFRKGFDSINRKLLWYSIMNKGIHGRLFLVIENMYSKVKAAVRISNISISSYFGCVRQRYVLSPFLFAMFISELLNMLEDAELRGIFVGQ